MYDPFEDSHLTSGGQTDEDLSQIQPHHHHHTGDHDNGPQQQVGIPGFPLPPSMAAKVNNNQKAAAQSASSHFNATAASTSAIAQEQPRVTDMASLSSSSSSASAPPPPLFSPASSSSSAAGGAASSSLFPPRSVTNDMASNQPPKIQQPSSSSSYSLPQNANTTPTAADATAQQHGSAAGLARMSPVPTAAHSQYNHQQLQQNSSMITASNNNPISSNHHSTTTTATTAMVVADNEHDDIDLQMRRSAQLRDAINKTLQLREEVVASQRECEKVRESLRRSEAETSSRDQDIKKLKQDHSTLLQEFKNMKDQAMNVCQQWQAKSNKDEQFIDRLEQSLNQAHAEREDALREHREAVRILRELQQSTADESKAHKADMQAMERTLVKADQRMQTLEEQRHEFDSLTVELRRQVTAHVSRNQRLQEQVLDLQSEKDRWRSECTEASSQVSDLQEEMGRVRQERARMSQDAIREAEAVKRLSEELEEKKTLLGELEDVAEALRKKLREAVDTQTKSTVSNDKLRLLLDRSEEENVVLNSRVAQLEAEVNKTKTSLDERQSEYQEEMVSQSTALHEAKEGLNKYQAEAKKLKEELNTAVNRVDALEADLTEARHEVVNVQRAHQQADEESRARQEEQLFTLNEQLSALTTEKKTSDTALADAVEKSKHTEEDMSRRLQAMTAELTASRDQTVALSECMKEQSDLYSSSERSVQGLRASLTVSEREMMFFLCSEEKQEAAFTHAQDIQRMWQQLVASVSMQHEMQMARAQQKTVDLQQLIFGHENTVNSVNQDMQKKNAELNEAHSTISALRRDILRLSQEHEEDESKMKSTEHQREEALQQVDELRRVIDDLKMQLSTTQSNSHQLQNNIQLLQSKIEADTAEKIDVEFALSEDNRRLRDELSELQRLHETSQKEREALLLHRDSLRNDVVALQGRVDSLGKESDAVAEISGERDSAFKRLQEVITLRQAEMREKDELVAKNRAMRQQLADAEYEFDKQTKALTDQLTTLKYEKESSVKTAERQTVALNADLTSKNETIRTLRSSLTVEQQKRQRGKDVLEEWKGHCEKYKEALTATGQERDAALSEKAELVQRYNRLADKHQRLGMNTSVVQSGQEERSADAMRMMDRANKTIVELKDLCTAQQHTLVTRDATLVTIEAALQTSEQARVAQHVELVKFKKIVQQNNLANVSSLNSSSSQHHQHQQNPEASNSSGFLNTSCTNEAGAPTTRPNPLQCSVVKEKPLNTTEGPRRHPKKVIRNSSGSSSNGGILGNSNSSSNNQRNSAVLDLSSVKRTRE